jgi:hypothetical protein
LVNGKEVKAHIYEVCFPIAVLMVVYDSDFS